MKTKITHLQLSIGVNMNKRNVIMILTDQMRGDCLGACGNEQIMTPFIDELAKDGILFTNAHAANPSCIAARASILTGLYAHQNGFFGYCDGIKWDYQNTIVDQFNNRGYKTINVGKTHFYPQRNDMNFSVNKLYDPQQLDKDFKSDYHIWLEKANQIVEDPAIIHDNNGWPVYEWGAPSYYHPTEWTLRTALDEISNCNGQAFFLQMSFHRPHPPFDPPQFYLNMYRHQKVHHSVYGNWAQSHKLVTSRVHGQYGQIKEPYLQLAKQAYYGLITHIDYQVGRLITFLKKNQMYENTTILFTSDHGEMLGDHYMFRKATPFRGAVHIPFILKNDKLHSVVDNRLVTHVDILPTLLEADNCQGYNLANTKKREVIIGEHPFDRGWHYVLTSEYKYIWDSESGCEWCFDVIEDEREVENIVTTISKDKLQALRQLLIDSFEKRELTQFIQSGKLRSGFCLPAYQKPKGKHG